MNISKFWNLIERGLIHVDQMKELPDWLELQLSMEPLAEIGDFEAWLAMCIDESDDELLWIAASIVAGSLSNDGFLYFRCWLIAQGERNFRNAVANPDCLAELDYKDRGMFRPLIQLEQMLYVATRAVNRKLGKPPFAAMELPSGYKPPPGCNPAATGRKNLGALRMEEDVAFLKTRFPKLLARFPAPR